MRHLGARLLWRSRRFPPAWWSMILAAAVLFFPSQTFAGEVHTNETSRSQFRFGFSSSMFTDVNENDARAGLKVWAQTLFKERGLPVDPEPVILKDVASIEQALRGKLIDAISLNTDEYWKLGEEYRAETFITSLNEGQFTEEYLLLVHNDSQIERIEDLRGRSLIFFQNAHMCLAPFWLDTVLVQKGLPRMSEYFRVTRASKLAKVVLPVFFRQADACVVTRQGFKIMSELNPQVSQRVKVLLVSQAMVPTGFVFRRDYKDPIKDVIMGELTRIKDSPAGAQVLTLFQSGSLKAQPVSCLKSAFELMETHQRLCETNDVKQPEANDHSVEAKGGIL